jgi:hypothetical protein
MTTLHLRKSIGRSPWRCGFLLLVLACFGLSPTAQALLPPPAPDGGYPNQNTAEGTNALFRLTTGIQNTAIGGSALFSNTTGAYNTATGFDALGRNTTGSQNTANGFAALFGNTTGIQNTATGYVALSSNTTGGQNTATGYGALNLNTIGSSNTANGFGALGSNTTGTNNTATGFGALNLNSTGGSNTANGFGALGSNTTGSSNTATGVGALSRNTTGPDNTANGLDALGSNTAGYHNTANGFQALSANTTGNYNTANGVQALYSNTTANDNTANGYQALFNNTGNSNIALGNSAGSNLTTGSFNIDIGNAGVAGDARKIRIGTVGTETVTFISGIHGVAVTGTAVVVSGSGQLGVAPSSARFKDAIKPMGNASKGILALKPVIFRYKKDIDPDTIPQFGLVAEEVEKVNPDLVARDAEGKPYTVRYEAVNAMLLNEFLKEHQKVQDLEKQIETLTAGLQKVGAQLAAASPSRGGLEAIKFAAGRIRGGGPAPQVVKNP